MSLKKTFIIKEGSEDNKNLSPDAATAMLSKPYEDGGPQMQFEPLPTKVAEQIYWGLQTMTNHLSDGWDFGDPRMREFRKASDVIVKTLELLKKKKKTGRDAPPGYKAPGHTEGY
jgi:hypothetical protein